MFLQPSLEVDLIFQSLVSAVGAEMEEELGSSDTIVECCGVFKVFVVDLVDSRLVEFAAPFSATVKEA